MASITYTGTILPDRHLSLPDEAWEELDLRTGEEVQVVLETLSETNTSPDEAYLPLRKLIGLCKDGRPDAARNHDRYLYQEDKP